MEYFLISLKNKSNFPKFLPPFESTALIATKKTRKSGHNPKEKDKPRTDKSTGYFATGDERDPLIYHRQFVACHNGTIVRDVTAGTFHCHVIPCRVPLSDSSPRKDSKVCSFLFFFLFFLHRCGLDPTSLSLSPEQEGERKKKKKKKKREERVGVEGNGAKRKLETRRSVRRKPAEEHRERRRNRTPRPLVYLIAASHGELVS